MPIEIPQILATGLGLTEGPLWTSEGRLWIVSVSRGFVYDVDPDGQGARRVTDVGGAPSGLAEDADGHVWIAQGGSQLRRNPDRFVRPAVQRLNGDHVHATHDNRFDAPNDLALGPGRRLYVTDPSGQALHGEPEPGRIWSLGIDEPSAAPTLLADDVAFPNGLAFTEDLRYLYVAETARRRLVRYTCRPDGGLGDATSINEWPDGHPDGLALDVNGNVYVAATTASAVSVVSPDGRELERVATGPGSLPTSVCFGGPDLSILYVTDAKGGRVLGFRRDTPGLRLPVAARDVLGRPA